jgi:hypothetical protein
MGGTAPANQLRLSFAGSEDGEAETETCRAAKPLWRTTTRTSSPRGLNSLNRRMRTRMYGGVAGESGRPLPLCRWWHSSPSNSVLLLPEHRDTRSSTASASNVAIIHQCQPLLFLAVRLAPSTSTNLYRGDPMLPLRLQGGAGTGRCPADRERTLVSPRYYSFGCGVFGSIGPAGET